MGCAQSKNVIRVHEVQIYSRGETSHQTWNRRCEKNPGHKEYVPVKDFKLQHLPDRYRDQDIFELIQTLSQLTVKISAKRVSACRPKNYPGDTTALYPFYKEKAALRSGTGRICRVNKHENDPKEPCPCKLCKNTSSPEVSWGELFVVTATHVIYDQDETADASYLLNYDSRDDEGRKLDDANFMESEITDDKCWLRFFTHDLQLTDEIVAKVCRYDQLCELLNARYKQEDTTPQGENRFAVIVSHPHGSYKRVSVGEWTQRELMDKYHTQYVYNAMTCPGTSGATVYTLSMPGWS